MNAMEPPRLYTTDAMSDDFLDSARKFSAQLRKTKEAILAEYSVMKQTQEHLLRLAVTEAEALAWETEYPHLVFPILAHEKAQAVAAWESRQRSLRRADRSLSIAA